MVQAKTSDFQPLPLKILNVLSLLAGASLLVAVSWEILLGDPRHYSTDYLLLQGVVCVIFLADFFVRMLMADHMDMVTVEFRFHRYDLLLFR